MADAIRVIDRAEEIVVSPAVRAKTDVQEVLEALDTAFTASTGAPDDATYLVSTSTPNLPNQINLGAQPKSGLLAVSISGGIATFSTTTDYAAFTDPRFRQMTRNVVTAQTYTFLPGDAGKVVEGTHASAKTFTVDTYANQPIPVGAVIEIFQDSPTDITIAAAGGVTLQSNGAKVKTAAQYATISLRHKVMNVWVLSGDLA